jgi:hypothetical protein
VKGSGIAIGIEIETGIVIVIVIAIITVDREGPSDRVEDHDRFDQCFTHYSLIVISYHR